jgi:hypothetical protein
MPGQRLLIAGVPPVTRQVAPPGSLADLMWHLCR